MATVQIGPDNQKSKLLMKAIISRKHHLDLVFRCDDGTYNAHKFMVAAQSKFMKHLLLSQDDLEMAEIFLPGIKIEHLKRALKFMYTGKLTVTNAELHKNFLVWHVQKIITEIFRIDANLNLGSLKLNPPPEERDDGEPPPPPPPDPPGGSPSNSYNDLPAANSRGSEPGSADSNNYRISSDEGYRQHKGRENSENDCTDDNFSTFSPKIQCRKKSNESEVEILEPPRVPTPQIFDLLDSGDEQETHKAPSENEGLSLFDADEKAIIESENVEDDIKTELDNFGTKQKNIEPTKLNDSISKHRETKFGKRGPKKKGKKKGQKKSNESTNRKSKKSKTESKKIVYRGKLINAHEKPKKKAPMKGVRKHIHNAWTLTGLKRAESLVTVKEESAEHACDKCDAVFQKHRSLVVHKQRNHNVNMKSTCPECGKKLSTPNAIKKHLLTHRPEDEWPFECPLCHKKFQARADIPKHLMTKMHEKDNIPKMGTKEWFTLLYPDRYGDVKDMIIKVEKQKEKEREKLLKLKDSGISVEEYNSWDPTVSNDQQYTSCIISGRRSSSTDDRASMAKRKSNSDNDSEHEEIVTKRTRRSAATTANSFRNGERVSEEL